MADGQHARAREILEFCSPPGHALDFGDVPENELKRALDIAAHYGGLKTTLVNALMDELEAVLKSECPTFHRHWSRQLASAPQLETTH